MKKTAALLAVLLALTALCGALAESAGYTDRARAFTITYDTDQFDIISEEYASDAEDADVAVTLQGKVASWGEASVVLRRTDLAAAGSSVQAQVAQLEATLNTQAEEMEWNGMEGVYNLVSLQDGAMRQFFLIPMEGDRLLSITVSVQTDVGEQAGMIRDDAIIALLESLVLNR